jgi:glycopeptide antibiotics resistance protein
MQSGTLNMILKFPDDLYYITKPTFMKKGLLKILVILPAAIISLFYLRVLYDERYSGASSKRVGGLILSVVLLYAWMIFVTIRKKQTSFFDVVIQSSFFVYVFAVLQLTGYFILFKEISSHGWWDNMNHRIDIHDHVNFVAFKTIGIYHLFDKQVAGNFIMLLPLGIYLPLLNKRLRKVSGFLAVLLISFLVSVGIETLQLATNYRSTDIDDVILNTAGVCAGFILYQLIKLIVNTGNKRLITEVQ